MGRSYGVASGAAAPVGSVQGKLKYAAEYVFKKG